MFLGTEIHIYGSELLGECMQAVYWERSLQLPNHSQDLLGRKTIDVGIIHAKSHLQSLWVRTNLTQWP